MIGSDRDNRRPTGPNEQKMRERLWRYGPLVFWLTLIFFASTDGMSASNTSGFVISTLRVLLPGVSEQGLASAHFIVRKGAHFTEYAVLALLAARAFLTSSSDRLRQRWSVVALSLVIIYSLLDEYHQTFASSRTGSIYDSFIDIAGGAAALMTLAFWRMYHGGKTSYASNPVVASADVPKQEIPRM